MIHPQSIVHALVRTRDASVLAHMGPTDMRCPIQHALTHPRRAGAAPEPVDLATLGTLAFEPIDPARHPAIGLALRAIDEGAGAVLNAANEVAAHAFLAGAIALPEIARAVEAALDDADRAPDASLEGVLALDERTRRVAHASAWARRRGARHESGGGPARPGAGAQINECAALAQRDPAKASQRVARLLKSNPRVAALHTLSAMLASNTGRRDRAVHHARRAAELAPEDPETSRHARHRPRPRRRVRRGARPFRPRPRARPRSRRRARRARHGALADRRLRRGPARAPDRPRAQPDVPDALVNRALLELDTTHAARAIEILESAPDSLRAHPYVLDLLALAHTYDDTKTPEQVFGPTNASATSSRATSNPSHATPTTPIPTAGSGSRTSRATCAATRSPISSSRCSSTTTRARSRSTR